jgi:hypothetical protein
MIEIESPALQQWRAEAIQETIVEILKHRFGKVPRDVNKLLCAILDDKKLRKLSVVAAKCCDIEAFLDTLLRGTSVV